MVDLFLVLVIGHDYPHPMCKEGRGEMVRLFPRGSDGGHW